MSPAMLQNYNAVVLHGAKDLRIEQRLSWPPAPNQAQVRITSTGLCGSDLHYYVAGRNGDFVVRDPLVLGHEASGVVTALGAQVTNLRVGQRVAIECGIMCNNCDYCKKGRYNLCKGMRFCSSAKTYPHLDGMLQQTVNHPAHLLHPIPDSVPSPLAALAEPLSVLIHASRRATLQKGSTALVFGVGAIGLLACSLARARGATKVVALDINEQRLQFAKDNGFADSVYCVPKKPSPPPSASTTSSTSANGAGSVPPPRPTPAQDPETALLRAKETITHALQEFGEPDGFDVVFECTGAEACIQMSIHACIPGGKVVLIGMGAQNVLIPVSAAATREVDILGSFRYANTYPEAIKLLSEGSLTGIDKLITHTFKLEQTQEAFELLKKGVDEQGRGVVKVLVECD